jgi:hypothetical protein
MSDETNGFHHIEIHTIRPDYLLDLFIRIYNFQLIAKRSTLNYSQWFVKSYECQLIISSISNPVLNNENNSDKNHYDILTSILSNKIIRDFIINRDTVFNVALHVKSVQTILDNNSDVQVREQAHREFVQKCFIKILVPRRQATDEYGSIEYACIKSCIGNVVHTLIDTSQYSGFCLPGFIQTSILEKQEPLINGIDHVAFAMTQHSALSTVVWYEKVLGMKRFTVNQ